MKTKRFFGFIITLAMLMSTISSFAIVHAADEPTDYYFLAAHKTTGANDYLDVNLDEIFKTGETYKITFNAKPDDTSAAISNKLAVFLNGGDISFANDRDRRLVYLYEENGGFHGLGMNKWSNIGYIQGYRGNIQKMGVDIEMIWDTEAGTVDFTILLPESGYSDRIKTYKWTPGKVTGEYGRLSIGAERTSVAIRDLRIKNVNALSSDSYNLESYQTLCNGDKFKIDLDGVFNTGKTYKITFNAKPDDTSAAVSNKLGVFLEEGDISFAKNTDRRLVYLYEENGGFQGMGMNNWNNIGYIQGYRGNIQKMGVDIEMIWDTEAGTVDFTVLLPESGYGDNIKKYKWTPGKVTGKYGKLTIGAESTTVAIRDLKIATANAPGEDEEKDPTGEYHLDSYTTEKGRYLKVNLDEVFQSGLPYVLKWNMKPSVYAGSCANIDIVDGDIVIQNKEGQKFGLFNIHEENGNNHALGLGDWYKIGNVTSFKDSVPKEGINVTILWDTGKGNADITIGFPGKDYTYSWEPGVITGEYGNLRIGAVDAGMVISDLSIELSENYEVLKPLIQSDKIKFEKYNGETIAFTSIVPASTKKIIVDFPTDMSLASMNPESIVLKNITTGDVVSYTCKKSVKAYEIHLNDLLNPKSEYSLTFADTVANAVGETIGSPVSFDFATDEGDYKLFLNGISVGTNTEPTIDEIIGSSEINININAINSAALTKNVLLIVTFYKGNELKKAFYDNFEIGSDIKNGVVSRKCNVIPSDADNLRVFLWDGVNTMISYDKELIVKKVN